MCGRYALSQSPSAYADWFGVDAIVTESLEPSYNVAPTDPVYGVAEHDDSRQLGTFRWGLIPWFAKDRKSAARHINARIETVASKASFKDSLEHRRCIIPADGFYEWKQMGEGKGKLPYFIYGAQRTPLGFAGLWASWKDPETGERLTTCTILTTSPTPAVAPIHDRMPVILPRGTWAGWLDREVPGTEALQLVRDAERVELDMHPVSTLVNSVKNNLPELVEPLT